MFEPQRLREARAKANLSMASVVRMVTRQGYSMTRASLCNWERGLRVPKATILAPLAKLYQVDVSFFFSM